MSSGGANQTAITTGSVNASAMSFGKSVASAWLLSISPALRAAESTWPRPPPSASLTIVVAKYKSPKPIRAGVRCLKPANKWPNFSWLPSCNAWQPMTTPATKRGKSTEESNAFKKNDRTTKSKPPKITAKLAAMAIQRPGCRLKNLQPSAIHVQPWPTGTECPSATKFCCAAMADPPWLLLLQSYSYCGNRLGHQRAVLVFRLAVDEDHAAAVLQHPRLGEQPCAAAAADEGSAHVDGDHAQGIRMKRARRGAQRDV